MKTEEGHPAWWQLYLFALGTLGLLVVGARVLLSEGARRAAEIGVLLVAFGLVELWLRANRRALLRDGLRSPQHAARPQLARQLSEVERQPVRVSGWHLPDGGAGLRAGGAPGCGEQDG